MNARPQRALGQRVSVVRRVRAYGLLLLAGGFFGLPVYWSALWSTWNNEGIFSFPPKFLPGPWFGRNLAELGATIDIWRVTLNTLVIAGVSTAGALLFCTMAGFAFAKYRFVGRNALFYLLLATMAVPGHIVLIPLFVIMAKVGWVNTYPGMIAPFLVPAMGVFFMRQSIESTIPDELLDAAKIDGAGDLRILFQVVVPVLLPNLAALTILIFCRDWGALFWPLIMARTPDMFTLPVAITAVAGQFERPFGQVMIGSVLSVVLPIVLFFAMQRYFVRGLNVGSIK